MRRVSLLLFAVIASAMVPLPVVTPQDPSHISGVNTCAARVAGPTDTAITWHVGPVEDAHMLGQWCRGVGNPLVFHASTPDRPPGPPPLESLVVVTWNAHLAGGELETLVANLRAGRLTDGVPVDRFVLLLQELYRRGPEVPTFGPDTRSAFAIRARNPNAPDARQYGERLGLSLVYIPSMRNGADLFEDRGNAIVSTEPLHDLFALELPFERQRRVAIGATINVRTGTGIARLNLLNTHLEPLSSPKSLWVFRNPRRRQVAAILDMLQVPRFEPSRTVVGTIVGGDFNTIQDGVEEEAYTQARAWTQGLVAEDPRTTHYLGRLDYLFVRLAPEWAARTTRANERFGSDHFPVIGRFSTSPGR
ncbi:MAG TPA: endonuclease/exonuclease/phosphatase family protein [Vicinamibacterales bacterium]|nr:endonuclease/exonuclease/phosphatase family protein [Vicinamibacterales bacterium]